MESLNPFFDTDEQEREYYAILDTIPMMGSENYRSPLLGYKFDSSCEDMNTPSCRCIEFDKEQELKHGKDYLSIYSSRYNPGIVWSDVMRAPDSVLFSDEQMKEYI